jgi:hypothetical protein
MIGGLRRHGEWEVGLSQIDSWVGYFPRGILRPAARQEAQATASAIRVGRSSGVPPDGADLLPSDP